jgi:hypothetical protein
MKNIIFLGFLLSAIDTGAQLSIGSEGISIAAGSTFSSEGLTLIPQGVFLLSNNTIQKSSTPVNIGGSVNSIANEVYASSPLSFSGTIRLYYQDSELNGNPEAGLKMAYHSAGTWNSSNTSSVNTADNYVEETVTSKTFDALTASTYYSILPVSFVSFTAKKQADASVFLQWITASEQQNNHFAVERSSNGIHYLALGTVQASGNSNGAAYSFVDVSPVQGLNYYRIKQVDNNGREQVYGVRLVNNSRTPGSPVLYPNPVVNGFTVSLSAQPAKPLAYSIQNTNGQVLQNGTITSINQWIAIPHLLPGVYVLKLENGLTTQFTKQ